MPVSEKKADTRYSIRVRSGSRHASPALTGSERIVRVDGEGEAVRDTKFLGNSTVTFLSTVAARTKD
jgi:hypothetical protein